MARPRFRRVARKLIKITALFLGLLLIAGAGLYIWLGTAAGADFVFRRLQNMASAQGFSLSARTFEGPLPARLRVEDLTLSDAQGPLLRLETLETGLAPASLLRGVLRLPLVRLTGLEALRAPESSGSSAAGGPPALPFKIQIDELEIRDARLPAKLLNPEADPERPPLNLNAQGRAALSPARLDGRLELVLDGLGPAEAGPLKLTAAAAFDLTRNFDDFDIEAPRYALGKPLSRGLTLEITGTGLRLEAGLGRAGVGRAGETFHIVSLLGDTDLEQDREIDVEGRALRCGLASLKVAGTSPWLNYLLKLAGAPPAAAESELDLSLELTAGESLGLVGGRLKIYGRRWVWPEKAAPWLGPEAADWNFEARLDGGGGRPWQGAFRLATEADRDSFSGAAVWVPETAAAAPEIKFDLQGKSEAFSRPPLRRAGPLELKLKGGGRLDKLAATLEARLLDFHYNWRRAEDIKLTADLEGAARPDPARPEPSDWRGSLRLATTERTEERQETGELAGAWRFSPAESLFQLETLAGTLLGHNIKASLRAALKPAGSPPALDGELTVETENWKILGELLNFDLSGSPARLRATLAAGEAGQSADLELNLPDLKLYSDEARDKNTAALTRISLKLAAGDLFGRPEAKLNLNLGPGRAAGLAWDGGALQAEAKGAEGSYSLNLGGLAWPGVSAGNRLTASGLFDLSSSSAELSRLNLKAGPAGLVLAAPATFGWAGGFRLSPVKAKIIPGGEFNLSAELGEEETRLKAEIKNLPYSFLNLFTPAKLPEGRIKSLELNLERRGENYGGDLALKTDLALGRTVRPSLEATGRLENGLHIQGLLSGGPGWPAAGRLALNLPLSPGENGAPPRLDRQGELRGRLEFNGPLEPLWRLADQPDRRLEGRLQAEINLAGSPENPRPAGTLKATGGRYEDKTLGLRLRDLNLTADLNADQSLKVALSGRDAGRGSLSLQGEVSGLTRPVLKAQGRLQSLRPFIREDFNVIVSGELAAEGPLNGLALSSDLTVEEADLDLNLLTAGGSIAVLPLDEPARPDPAAGSLKLDLKLNVPGLLRVHGYGLDSLWRGHIQARGTGRPSLTGEFVPVRGWFEPPIFSRQFDFDGGRVIFSGGLIPELDLEFVNKTPELTAVIKASGSARKPRITLTSRPPLSQDEVAGRLLFGKSPSAISRFEAIQLAAVLKDVSGFGGGGLNPLKVVRDSLNLDVLRLGGASGPGDRQVSEASGSLAGEVKGRGDDRGGGQSEALSVEAGKYINDKVYMGMEHGTDGPAVRLEVELSPHVSLEARSSSESSQVGLGWKKDY